MIKRIKLAFWRAVMWGLYLSNLMEYRIVTRRVEKERRQRRRAARDHKNEFTH